MGVVYEAYDRELQVLVALKALRNDDGVWLARFKQEFHSLHDLAHRNLVALGELFDGPTGPFFTMELIRGLDFLAYVRNRGGRASASPDDVGSNAYDEPRLRAALRQLATGIAALHEAGKIHRDIKPSNILVAEDGRVVLLDFGLVAEVDATRRSSGGDIVGTVEYIAPEQALAGEISPASDWYSLGVLLFEALTGALPHTGRSPFEVIFKKHQVKAPAPRELAPDVPPDLDALCRALLEIAPADRPRARGIFERLGIATNRDLSLDRATGDDRPAPAPFVGRRAELATLRTAYAEVRGQPLVFLVEGVSGVGKSQLVDRFLEGIAAEAPDAVVLTGRCYEREIVPFKALDGIADSLALHLARMPPAEVSAVMPRRAALLARLFPVLRRVEAIAAAPLVPDVPDPHDQRQRMFSALRELFMRLADRSPLVWYIDDLQWTDADSLVLLAELLAHEDRLPVFIVATVHRMVVDPARRALLTQIEELAPTRRLQLQELSASEARELAARLLPGHAAATLDSVAADAGGHPLLLHELARHVDTADGQAGRSATLEEMLTQRIARLDAEARALLEVLAVFGGPLAQDVAALAAEMSSADQVRVTAVLRTAHLVRTDGIRRSDRVVIYHDRVREHVDAQLGAARRRHLHERLALALERSGAAEHNPRALVRHARAAGRETLAASYALAAARHAVTSLAFDQAAELFAAAINLGSYDDATLRGLRIDLATALAHAGRGPEAATTFMTAAQGAEPAIRLDCQRQAAEQWIITGHLQQGMAALRSSLDEIHEPFAASPRRALARVLWHRTRLRLRGMGHVGRLESQVPVETLRRLDVLRAVAHGLAMIDNIRGADFNGRYLRLALQTGEARRLVGALATEVVFLASQAGRAGHQARKVYAELQRVAQTCPDRAYARAWVLLADGAASFFEGRFAAAAATLALGEEVFAEGPRGLTYEKNNTRVFRVHALRMLGAVQQHGALIPELVRAGRHRGDRYLETTLKLLQVQSLLARGEVAEAHRNVEHATWTPPEDGYHLQHWYELRARVEIALYQGNAAAVLDRLDRDFAALRGSLLLRVKLVRADAAYLRGRLLLAAAHGDRAPAQGVDEVRGLVRQLEGERVGYATVFALLLGAGVAASEGRRAADQTVQCLRRAAAVAAEHDMAIQLAAARLRLAGLVGGDEGAVLRLASARYDVQQGIVDPDRFHELAAPGLALARP